MHSQQLGRKIASQGHGGPKRGGTEPPKDNQGRDRQNEKREGRRMGRDLSRDDFLFLLCMLEGELQVKDEVLTALKAEKSNSALLEAHYGLRGPEKVFQALRRDSLRAHQDQLHDVYEKPMAELDRLVEVWQRSSRRVLEQLAEVERSHSSALYRLEEQERTHRVFVQESDDLTNLLEWDRERLKLQTAKEKECQQRKEEESRRELTELREELSNLKAFASLVVNEQRRLTEQLEEQSQCVKHLVATTDHTKQELRVNQRRAKEEERKVLHLEAELLTQASIFSQHQEAMTAKLADEDAQNQHLRQRLVALCHQLDELEGTKSALRRAEEELQELRDKVRNGEEGRGRGAGPSSLLSEVEALRKRVLEMEGKDEELIRVADQCRELDRRLGRETSQGRSLRAEVDQLNRRISELDRLEEGLGKSRQECSTLKGNLDREKSVSNQLSGDLDALKARVRELEAIEQQLEKSETVLRQDMTKLRTLTIALVEDRKSMAERLRQAQEKLSNEEGKQNDQITLAIMTEKLREERQQALRSKADLEERVENITKEKSELQTRLQTEEGRSRDLQSTVHVIKKKLQVLESRKEREEKEKRMHINSPQSNTNHFYQAHDNKVKELSEEVEMLRRRIMEKEVVEGDLAKAEEDFESLERRFREEHERSQALTEELEVSKRELSRYQLAEKQEVNQEHILLRRLQQEQVKSRLLGRELDTLKDKLQKLTGTEESVSKVQMDHSSLQRKLFHQETRNRELAREMEALTSELERYRRVSKSLRPGVNGRRFSDLHQSTKEVQTEPADSPPPDYRNLDPSAPNGTIGADSDEEDSNQNVDHVITRNRSTPSNNLNSLNQANNNIRRYSSHSTNGMDMHQPVDGEILNGNLVKKGDVVLTHTPGQPLHIKVTPDHGLNMATLEISSPSADTGTSYTSTAVIPTSGASPKQRITIIQNSTLAAVTTKNSPSSPDRALSPLTGAPVSRLVSPGSSRSATPDHNSPVQIVTVSTCSPEPTEVLGQGVFRMSPERQNSWHVQRSNSTSASPSVIKTEDNKIHIHLGSPYIQGMNGIVHSMAQPAGPYYSLRQEQRTQMLTNGCQIKGGSKITSSITITPATSPVSHPSNVPIPLEMFQKPGPTRIPKPTGYSNHRGTNTALNIGKSKEKPPAVHMWKDTSLRMPKRPKATRTTC